MPRDLRRYVRRAIRSLLAHVLEDDLELEGVATVITWAEGSKRLASRVPVSALLKRDGTILVTLQYGNVVQGFLRTRGEKEDG